LYLYCSGLIRQKNIDDTNLPEIKTTSGRAYIYFYSDAAYNMSGFNISYRSVFLRDQA